jgi:hypothetical protein
VSLAVEVAVEIFGAAHGRIVALGLVEVCIVVGNVGT